MLLPYQHPSTPATHATRRPRAHGLARSSPAGAETGKGAFSTYLSKFHEKSDVFQFHFTFHNPEFAWMPIPRFIILRI